MRVRLKAEHLPSAVYDVHFAGRYVDHSPAFIVRNTGGNCTEKVMTLTVCMHPNEAPDDGCVFIKDWSENQGILVEMIKKT